MKKLILVLLCFALLVFGSIGFSKIIEVPDAIAWMPLPIVGGSPPSGEQTYSLEDSATPASAGSRSIYSGDTRRYLGLRMDITSSYTITKLVLYLSATGSPTNNLTVDIYDDNSGVPGSSVDAPSDPVDASTVGASEGAIAFTGLNAPVSSGVFWVVITASTGPDAVNYVSAHHGTTTEFDYIFRAQNLGTWTLDANRQAKFEAYSSP